MQCQDTLKVCTDPNLLSETYPIVISSSLNKVLGYDKASSQTIPEGYFCNYDIQNGHFENDFGLNIDGNQFQGQNVLIKLITT